MRVLVRIFGALLLVALIVVVGSLFYLDRIVAGVIERGGTYALGVDTELRSVQIRPIRGTFGFSGLAVSNPPGFKQKHFLRLERAKTQLRLSALREDPVKISSFELSGIAVSLERNKGRTNYALILDNLSRFESKPDPSEEGGGPGVAIEELLIRDIKAQAQLVPHGGKLTMVEVEVPEIRLRNIGSGSPAGVSSAEFASIVTRAILQAVLARSDKLPSGLVSDLGARLKKVGRVRIELGSSFSDGSAKAGQQLKDAMGEAGDLLEGLGKRLRGWKDR